MDRQERMTTRPNSATETDPASTDAKTIGAGLPPDAAPTRGRTAAKPHTVVVSKFTLVTATNAKGKTTSGMRGGTAAAFRVTPAEATRTPGIADAAQPHVGTPGRNSHASATSRMGRGGTTVATAESVPTPSHTGARERSGPIPLGTRTEKPVKVQTWTGTAIGTHSHPTQTPRSRPGPGESAYPLTARHRYTHAKNEAHAHPTIVNTTQDLKETLTPCCKTKLTIRKPDPQKRTRCRRNTDTPARI
jgi:hypothetical protein